MRQQEDFRTPDGAQSDARASSSAPLFDERSARRAAPVVPHASVARRRRFADWTAGGWRETVNSPQFRRSWPLALLLVATLAAAVAATNFYDRDDAAQTAAPATAATAADTAATADAEQTARSEIENSREARGTRRASEDDDAAPDEKSVVNSEALTASALGSLLGGAGDAGVEQDAASGRDERNGRRDGGKRNKSSKRRQGARRGGAVLFDVIR